MGLILLIVVGGVLGWLASIVMQRDSRRGVLLNVAVGVGVALLAGLASNNGSIFVGLSASALLIALAASMLGLTIFNVVRGGHPG
jgi:uncharacterized membrane protein YeaQ/YmgE (transglycosylase-associated protein family)